MIIIAICACFFPMLTGISGFMVYRGAKAQEMAFRDNASALRRETEGEPPNHAMVWERAATEWERNADSAASNAQRHWNLFVTAVALVGLGIISGGLAITLRIFYGPGFPTRSRLACYLFSISSKLAWVLIVAFGIAACLQLLNYAILYVSGKL
jgi:hypothetical protein